MPVACHARSTRAGPAEPRDSSECGVADGDSSGRDVDARDAGIVGSPVHRSRGPHRLQGASMTTIGRPGEFGTPGDAARAIWMSVAAACGRCVVMGGRRLAGDRPNFDVTFRDGDGREFAVTVTIEGRVGPWEPTVAAGAPARNPGEPATRGDGPRIWSGPSRYPGAEVGRSPSPGPRRRERGHPRGSAAIAREATRPWRSPG